MQMEIFGEKTWIVNEKGAFFEPLPIHLLEIQETMSRISSIESTDANEIIDKAI